MAQVFISHVDAEKALAGSVEGLLKDVLQPASPSVFCSSNMFSLVGGEQFERRIRRELAECELLIAMCSDRSFQSHWIHVEAGAAWALGKPVIPVCYGGKTLAALPRPYSSFQVVDLSDPYRLVVAVSSLLRISPPAPPGIYLTGPKFERGIVHAGHAYERLQAELLRLYPVVT